MDSAQGTNNSTSSRPERVGRYRLVRSLGRGGMGEVWLATEESGEARGRNVALKLLPPGGIKDSTLVRRLTREASIIGRLDHPNIVSLYEFDRDETNDLYYLAMEYVSGMDLKRVFSLLHLSGRRSMDLDLAVYLVMECLAGLGYAHGLHDEDGQPLDVVHRDISPSNILCSKDGLVKLADFGIAKWRNASGATTEEFLVGKIPYMSPEQVDGLAVDRRSDLWAVGVLLYEAATGVNPFGGRTPVERMAQILGLEIEPASEVRRDLPDWVDEYLSHLLTRDRADRFGSAGEALETLLEKAQPRPNGAADLADLVHRLERDQMAAPTENLAWGRRAASRDRRYWSGALRGVVRGVGGAAVGGNAVPGATMSSGARVVSDPGTPMSTDEAALGLRGLGVESGSAQPTRGGAPAVAGVLSDSGTMSGSGVGPEPGGSAGSGDSSDRGPAPMESIPPESMVSRPVMLPSGAQPGGTSGQPLSRQTAGAIITRATSLSGAIEESSPSSPPSPPPGVGSAPQAVPPSSSPSPSEGVAPSGTAWTDSDPGVVDQVMESAADGFQGAETVPIGSGALVVPGLAQDSVPNRAMSPTETTAPRWGKQIVLGATSDAMPVSKEDLSSGQVLVASGVIDLESPRVIETGVMRHVLMSMESLTEGQIHCWLRSLPDCLLRDEAAVQRYQDYLDQVNGLRVRPGSRLYRSMARLSGLLDASELADQGVLDEEGNRPSGYQVVDEPEVVPLDRFMRDLFEVHLPMATAPVVSSVATSDQEALAQWLRLTWRIDVGVDLVRELLWGLAEVHAAGLQHGGLTPQSILVLPRRRDPLPVEVKSACWIHRSASCLEIDAAPRTIDFGLAESLTRMFAERVERFGLRIEHGTIQGDLSRLEPEQIDEALAAVANPLHLYSPPEVSSGAVGRSPQCDVYFCGLLLYEIIAGRFPFRERSAYTSLSRLLDPAVQPIEIRKLNPLVSERLGQVVHRALDRDPTKRFENAAVFALELEDLRSEVRHDIG
ncbi:MAG: protein kinase [Deltaproteobacteria bacterium]|nr:protein kinase [Deltaproteobacteria bacterium]